MKFKNQEVHDAISRLKKQYYLFSHNQFISYYLLASNIPKNDILDVEDLIDSDKYYVAEGYDLQKLYEQILVFVRFMQKVKEKVLSQIENDSERRLRKLSHDDKVLFRMTIDNIPKNIKMFHQLISELFIEVRKQDRTMNGEDGMLFYQLPWLKEIEKALDT